MTKQKFLNCADKNEKRAIKFITEQENEQYQCHYQFVALNVNDSSKTAVVDVLEGNVREIIGQMKLEDIVQDRKLFAEKVQENAAPDMERMGLEIVSFNVQNVTDEGNVIENLGIDRVVSISKSAQISRAESERDIAVAKANAEKQANDARIEAETAIAERNNELEIKKQELKR